MIKFRSKSQLSTQIRCWISNWTEIDNGNRPACNPNHQCFDSEPLNTLANCPASVHRPDYPFNLYLMMKLNTKATPS